MKRSIKNVIKFLFSATLWSTMSSWSWLWRRTSSAASRGWRTSWSRCTTSCRATPSDQWSRTLIKSNTFPVIIASIFYSQAYHNQAATTLDTLAMGLLQHVDKRSWCWWILLYCELFYNIWWLTSSNSAISTMMKTGNKIEGAFKCA